MSENETINSAMLTATIKSLKLLTSIKDVQNQLLEDVNQIKKQQVEDHEKIELLNESVNNLPSSDDIHDLNILLTKIDTQVNTLNQETIITSVNDTINNKFDTTDKAITDAVSVLSSSLNDSENKVLEAVINSDKSTSLETIMKLIDGLKNVHNNVVTVANRMETLSNNIKGVRGDFGVLSDTIRDSNSRVKSMDLRMAVMSESTDVDDVSDINSALALLEDVNPPKSITSTKPALPSDKASAIIDTSDAVSDKASVIIETGDDVSDTSGDKPSDTSDTPVDDDNNVEDAIAYINGIDVGSESGKLPHE